jgi:hypothetical protein
MSTLDEPPKTDFTVAANRETSLSRGLAWAILGRASRVHQGDDKGMSRGEMNAVRFRAHFSISEVGQATTTIVLVFTKGGFSRREAPNPRLWRAARRAISAIRDQANSGSACEKPFRAT